MYKKVVVKYAWYNAAQVCNMIKHVETQNICTLKLNCRTYKMYYFSMVEVIYKNIKYEFVLLPMMFKKKWFQVGLTLIRNMPVSSIWIFMFPQFLFHERNHLILTLFLWAIYIFIAYSAPKWVFEDLQNPSQLSQSLPAKRQDVLEKNLLEWGLFVLLNSVPKQRQVHSLLSSNLFNHFLALLCGVHIWVSLVCHYIEIFQEVHDYYSS